jgi:hypothetical protein
MAYKMTQADRDAGLTQADVDAGLRGGRNERITDEDRARAARNTARDGDSIVDKYRDYNKNPEAEAIPVDMGSRAAPRATPRAAPRPAPVAREPMPNEIPSGYTPAEPRRAPPSRGRYDQNGPIGDLVDLIRGSGRTGHRLHRGQSQPDEMIGAKRGGSVKKMVKKASSASKRADGIATKGKTKGRMI